MHGDGGWFWGKVEKRPWWQESSETPQQQPRRRRKRLTQPTITALGVTVDRLDGIKSLELDPLPLSATVADIKAKISEAWGLPPVCQVLLLKRPESVNSSISGTSIPLDADTTLAQLVSQLGVITSHERCAAASVAMVCIVRPEPDRWARCPPRAPRLWEARTRAGCALAPPRTTPRCPMTCRPLM